MERGAKITICFIIAVVIISIAFDVWIGTTYGSGATISWVSWRASKVFPVIPFAVGVLCGHLFWVQQTGMSFPRRPQ